MSAPRTTTLPLAWLPPFTPRVRLADGGAAGGWSRAIEQAARAVRPADTLRSDGAARAAPVPPSGAQDIAKPAWSPHVARTRDASSGERVTAGSAVAVLPEEGGSPAFELPPAASQAAAGARLGGTRPPREDIARPVPARPLSSDAAAVRMHVERGADGCAVWLGIDRHAQAAAAHLVAALCQRPSGARGAAPVVSIVCNGTPVYTRPRTCQETP